MKAENCKSYADYIKTCIKESPAVGRLSKVFQFLRRSLFLTRVMRAVWLVLSFLQTGAFFIIAFSALAALLPAFFLFAVIISAANLIRYKKRNKVLNALLEGKKTDVIILPFKGDENDLSGDIRIIVRPYGLFVFKEEK